MSIQVQPHTHDPVSVSVFVSPADESFQTPPSSPESTTTLVPPPTTSSASDPTLSPARSPSPLAEPPASCASSFSYPEKPRVRVTSIRFAPLPAIDPSKKRNNIVPLGVNARSRRRRDWQQQQQQQQQLASGYDYNNTTPSLFAPQPQPHQQQQQQQRVSLWDVEYSDMEEEERTEDPIVVLGRMLRDTSVSLWKRVASRRKGRSPSPPPEQRQQEDARPDERVMEIGAGEVMPPEEEDAGPGQAFDVITMTEREAMPVLPLLDVDIARSPLALESQEGEAIKDEDEDEEDRTAARKRRLSCPDGSCPSSPVDSTMRRRSWSTLVSDASPVSPVPLPPIPPLPVLTLPDF